VALWPDTTAGGPGDPEGGGGPQVGEGREVAVAAEVVEVGDEGPGRGADPKPSPRSNRAPAFSDCRFGLFGKGARTLILITTHLCMASQNKRHRDVRH